MAISSSPERHTFQRKAYLDRCEEEGKAPDEEHMDMFDQILENARKRTLEMDDNSLEWHLRTTDWILEKVRASEVYAQNLYAAMCNNSFLRLEVIPILKDEHWHCSWRYAGGIIADMRQEGDYIDWYCSGIRDSDSPANGFVGESFVTDEIREDLLKLGWKTITDDDSSTV
jgi:hypothetical protein